MSKKPKIYTVDLDDLDNLIISIIRRNNGITVAMLHHNIERDFGEDINPAIILSRIERLITFNIIFNNTESIGKYMSRRFYYNKDNDIGENGSGEHQ